MSELAALLVIIVLSLACVLWVRGYGLHHGERERGVTNEPQ
jgi:hypothetical protein